MRIARLLALAVVVAACSPAADVTFQTSPTAAPTPDTATVTTPPGPSGPAPIEVTGNNKTGVSPKFKLTAGTYTVAWTTTASKASCAFSLFLATKPNGPTIKDTGIDILPEKKEYRGGSDWTGVKAGTYVLQEDRSGLLNCTGMWNATLTKH